MKYAYPAIFKRSDDGEFTEVDFPDIVCGVTCGTSYENAIFMAQDILKLMILEVPNQVMKPSKIEDLITKYPNEKIVIVSFCSSMPA